LISIISAVTLLVASFAGNISPKLITVIQPLTLVYPIIVIINIGLLLYWITARSKISLIILILLLVVSNDIFTNFQITFLNSPKNDKEDIKLLSYNVKNFNERDNNSVDKSSRFGIIRFLNDEDPDIICTQEYYSTNTNLYEPLKQFRDTLGMKSYYYESYFNPKYNQLLGLATFSKYQAINKGKLKFEGSRSFGIYTDLIVNNDTLRIFNIHLASIKLTPEDLDFVMNTESDNENNIKNKTTDIYFKMREAYLLREMQVKYLMKVLEQTRHKVIMAGDFNDTPSSWVYKNVSKDLTDAFVSKGIGLSPTYAGPLPFLRIDYILVDQGYDVTYYSRHKFENSDHYPISAVIKAL
jgi:endonuclease/exonuclease/phosphatase family metal-dependent hydrolase